MIPDDLVQCHSLLTVLFPTYFRPVVQQMDASGAVSPDEKRLQQTDLFNSHHKAKKARLDEPLPGGLFLLLSDSFCHSFLHHESMFF